MPMRPRPFSATAVRMSVSTIEPVAPYSRANPKRNNAAASAPRKKYLIAASCALREARLIATMMYVGRLVSSSARKSQMRSGALQHSITPMRLSRKNAKYSPRLARIGSKAVRPPSIAAS